jgi:hypothetical protein
VHTLFGPFLPLPPPHPLPLSVVLIYIFFMAENVEQFGMCLLAICISESCLFSSFAHLLTGLFFSFSAVIIRALCIFWILILYALNSWQRFSPVLWVIS